VPWFDAALYEVISVLDGRELVELPGPSLAGCDVDDPDCNRRDRVPRPYLTPTIDGQDYEVFQAVTWADASQQAKRFTTVVRWTYLDQELEEVFESERTATAAEAGDPTIPRVIQFSIGPSPMTLTEDGFTPQPLNVVVRFSQGVDSAQLRFYSVASTPTDAAGAVQLTERSITLVPEIFEDGKGVEFRGTVPAGGHVFPTGPRTFRAVGTLASEPHEGAASVSFIGGPYPATADPGVPDGVGDDDGGGEDEDGGSGEEPPTTPVALPSRPTFTPSLVCMDANHRFDVAVTVQVSVDGMTSTDHNVSLEYTANGSTRSERMVPVTPDAVSETGAPFQKVFAANTDHGFRVPNGNKTETSFTVRASRLSDGGSAGPVVSQTSLDIREKGKGC
jgi:hypothetical protein